MVVVIVKKLNVNDDEEMTAGVQVIEPAKREPGATVNVSVPPGGAGVAK